jgi:hypothetical protein
LYLRIPLRVPSTYPYKANTLITQTLIKGLENFSHAQNQQSRELSRENDRDDCIRTPNSRSLQYDMSNFSDLRSANIRSWLVIGPDLTLSDAKRCRARNLHGGKKYRDIPP